jgi:hypothetical protein
MEEGNATGWRETEKLGVYMGCKLKRHEGKIVDLSPNTRIVRCICGKGTCARNGSECVQLSCGACRVNFSHLQMPTRMGRFVIPQCQPRNRP